MFRVYFHKSSIFYMKKYVTYKLIMMYFIYGLEKTLYLLFFTHC